jgi:hypothetical protein
MRVFEIDRGIQEYGLCVYYMHNIVEFQFDISIVPVRSQGVN